MAAFYWNVDDEGVQEYVDAYRQAHGSPPGGYGVYTYNAVNLIAQMVEEGNDTPETFREGMEGLEVSLRQRGTTCWPAHSRQPSKRVAAASSWSATGPGPVEPGVVRAASAPRTDSTSRTSGVRCGLIAAKSWSVISSRPQSRAAQITTSLPVISCASRNGTPLRT